MRQAFAGMLWSKQLYAYDVDRWLDGDPTQPTPPASRLQRPQRRLAHVRRLRHHVDARQVGVPVVRRLGPRLPLRRARPRRPGLREVPADPALPRVVPAPERRARRPTSGRSTTSTRRCRRGRRSRCSRSTAARDLDFLSRVFDKLLVNFTWWVNREDATASNLFEGGFLGLDNIGPIDRSHLPPGYTLEQSDSTGLDGVLRAQHGRDRRRSCTAPAGRTTDLVVKFLEHFALISEALQHAGPVGRGGRVLLRPAASRPTARRRRSKVRSMVGVLPLLAVAVVDERVDRAGAAVNKRGAGLLARRQRGDRTAEVATACSAGRRRGRAPARRRRARARAAAVRAPVRRGARSSRRTGCGRSRATTCEHPFSIEVDGQRSTRSTTSRRSRPPACSAATRTGAGRSGCPSTTWSSARSTRYARFLGDDVHARVPDRLRDAADARRGRRRPAPPADLARSSSAPTGGGRASAGSSGSRPTRSGRTTSSSTSTSTATTAPGSARRTRPAGPGSSPT